MLPAVRNGNIAVVFETGDLIGKCEFLSQACLT